MAAPTMASTGMLSTLAATGDNQVAVRIALTGKQLWLLKACIPRTDVVVTLAVNQRAEFVDDAHERLMALTQRSIAELYANAQLNSKALTLHQPFVLLLVLGSECKATEGRYRQRLTPCTHPCIANSRIH
eukprot:2249607-Rhodomonas_salina.1